MIFIINFPEASGNICVIYLLQNETQHLEWIYIQYLCIEMGRFCQAEDSFKLSWKISINLENIFQNFGLL